MDITLVREAKQKSEMKNGEQIKYIDISDISDISKSTLRILYECGERPLYTFEAGDNAEYLSVNSSPQKRPDCIIVLGNKKNTQQSATVLKEQLADVGIDLPVMQLDQLENSASTPQEERITCQSLKHKLHGLEKKGYQHIIVIADSKKLDTIYKTIINENLPGKEEPRTCLWGIRDGKPAYVYNSQVVDYVTEGLLDTKLVSQINGENCPQFLMKFHGKIKKPIDEYKFFYKFQEKSK